MRAFIKLIPEKYFITQLLLSKISDILITDEKEINLSAIFFPQKV